MELPKVDNFSARKPAENFVGLREGYFVERNIESSSFDFGLKVNKNQRRVQTGLRLVPSSQVRAVKEVAEILNMLYSLHFLKKERCYVKPVTNNQGKNESREKLNISLPHYDWLPEKLSGMVLFELTGYANQAFMIKSKSGRKTTFDMNSFRKKIQVSGREIFEKHNMTPSLEQMSYLFILKFLFADKFSDAYYLEVVRRNFSLDLAIGVLTAGNFDVTDFDTLLEGTDSVFIRSIVLAAMNED